MRWPGTRARPRPVRRPRMQRPRMARRSRVAIASGEHAEVVVEIAGAIGRARAEVHRVRQFVGSAPAIDAARARAAEVATVDRCAGSLSSFVALAVVVAGCASAEREFGNHFGDCTFEPGAVCTNQDLSRSRPEATRPHRGRLLRSDLTGTDLREARSSARPSSSAPTSAAVDLTGADLRGADLTAPRCFEATSRTRTGPGPIDPASGICETFFPDGTVSRLQRDHWRSRSRGSVGASVDRARSNRTSRSGA